MFSYKLPRHIPCETSPQMLTGLFSVSSKMHLVAQLGRIKLPWCLPSLLLTLSRCCPDDVIHPQNHLGSLSG